MAQNQSILEGIGKELKNNPPSILSSTTKKFGIARAKKQKTAILLSKARKAGANIPHKGVQMSFGMGKVKGSKGVTGKMSMAGVRKTPAKTGQFVTPAVQVAKKK